MRHLPGLLAVLILGLLALATVLLLTQNLAIVAARPLEAALSRALGRQVVIKGPIRLSLLPAPTLRLGQVSVANVPGGARMHLLLADTVEAEMALAGVLKEAPQLVITQINIDHAELALQQAPGGPNWLLAGSGLDRALDLFGATLPVVVRPGVVKADDLTLEIRTAWQTADVPLVINHLSFNRNGPLGEHVTAIGAEGHDPWRLELDTDALEALATGATLKMKGVLFGRGAQANFAGFASLLANDQTDITGSGTAADAARVYGDPVAADDQKAPANFTFELKNSGQVTQLVADFAQLGTGDLKLHLELPHKPGFALNGQIGADDLDLAALPRLDFTASDQRLLPQGQFAVAPLQGAQVDLKLTADEVSWRDKPIGRLDLGLWASHGILAAGPMRLSGPLAELSGDATLDVRAAPKLSLTMTAKVPDVGALAQALGTTTTSQGRIDAAIELLGTGDSAAAIMANSYGQTDLLVGPGHADPKLVAALPKALAFGVDDPPTGEADAGSGLDVGCLISRFDIDGGRAVSRALLVDTASAETTGQGTIDFGNESLNFHLAPRPKDPALIDQARDLVVSGTLAKPVLAAVDGEAKRGLSRMAGQAALTDGFDALMPLLDPDAALTNPCVRSLLTDNDGKLLQARPGRDRLASSH